MSPFFDDLEARHPEAREGALMAALPAHIAHAKANAPGFGRILRDVDSNDIKSRKSLARLPVTRKSDLQALQKAQPPLGGLNATPLEKLAKLFVSPGPLYDPEGRGADWWRAGRGLFAGGFRTGELVLNTFAYHFTPAGSMIESGALALGCTVIPAGTGQTEMQVAAVRDLRLRGYVGTPSFLKLIVEKADETKSDISSLRKAQVGAEYLPPALRQAMRQPGFPADSLRHRRPFRGPSRREPLRPHQRAPQGLDGPRRPEHQGPSDVRHAGPGRRGAATPSRGAARAPRGRRRGG